MKNYFCLNLRNLVFLISSLNELNEQRESKVISIFTKINYFLRKITLFERFATINDVQTFSYDIGDLTKKFNYWKFKSL